MGRPEPGFRPFVMDRPPLHVFVRELAEHERLQALVAALPTRARVSEPVLPLLLATLHEQLERGIVCVLPEDADARDASEAAGWFIGAERVALLPGRGVGWASGLDPPPHLVGERARALDVLARGGLVCASAIAVAEGMPPAQHRPAPIRLEVGEEPGVEGLSEAFALAGYERVERAEERGQFAVRGGIVDVFPTTGREPLRVEFFGDEIEQVRVFSPFTQRALHPVTDATVYPAAERRAELVDPGSSPLLAEEGAAPVVPADLVLALDRVPDFVWQPEEVRRVWAEEGLHPVGLKGATELDPFPQSQPFAFEAQRPALAARGLAEAEQELAGFVRAGNRVVVAFPHAGEALRTQNLLRRADAHMLEPGAELPEEPELLFAVAPARRGFVWRELGLVLLPDTQVFRKRPAACRPPPRSRARHVRRPAHRRLHRPRGSRGREAARLRDEGGRRRHARLPLRRLPRRGPALRPARAARQGLEVHRRRRRRADALQARRQGVGRT